MVLGTPNAVYDPDRASAMLHSVGEQPIAEARAALLARGVISNLVHDPKKPRPGRTLRFTDMYASQSAAMRAVNRGLGMNEP
jgi:hypothetical protein